MLLAGSRFRGEPTTHILLLNYLIPPSSPPNFQQASTPHHRQHLIPSSTQTMSAAAGLAEYKDREFIAVIGDEASYPPISSPPSLSPNASQDSVTGLLLAGIGVRPAPPPAPRTTMDTKGPMTMRGHPR